MAEAAPYNLALQNGLDLDIFNRWYQSRLLIVHCFLSSLVILGNSYDEKFLIYVIIPNAAELYISNLHLRPSA